MSDYSRRNRNSSSRGSDDFDWESFDRETSERMNNTGESPRRRRRTSDTAKRRRPAPYAAEQHHYQEERRPNPGRPQKPRKRKKQLTERQIMFRKRLRFVILMVVLVCVVVCSGMFIGMYAAVSREIKEMNIKNLALNYTSTIYYTDKNGNQQELDSIATETNRIWVDSSAISQNFKDAIVSIEDERFYQHNGVDIKRTIGATVKYIGAKLGIGESNYGGSTITQQVIKNITQEDDFKATRKVKEMMRAIALENQLTKDEILTMYCNIVYFANNCYGVESASKTYFDKSASELTLEEAASIAGITQYPAEFDPIAHKDKNVSKRNTVLGKMLELGKITQAEHDSAVAAPLVTSNAYRRAQAKTTSYFVDQVVNDVIQDLMAQKQYTEDFATSQVNNGGLKIFCTIDMDVQEIMEDVFENTDNFPYSEEAQSAMVVLDPYTGQIKGLIGGLGEKTDIRGFNRATQAIRQPGSAIKPLSVYSPALDHGDIREVDIVTDEEIEIGADNWKPKNSYDGFKGDMTIKEAVARSSNIPAVKVLAKLNLSNSFGYLQNKFHISTLTDQDKNYSSLALGGLTQGVTVKDMAAAYGVFANSGKYITPYTYTQVIDSQGNVILENRINEQQAISDAAAFIMTDLLSGPVNLSYGTATRARLDCDMPAYGKTGTTDDDFDKWFVGYTPYYVGAVWFGFDNPASLKRAGISGNPCVTAWKKVFDEISESQEIKEIEPPESVVEERVCSISGLLANDSCDAETAYFVSGTQPKSYCNSHRVKQTDGFYKQEKSDDESETQATAAPVRENSGEAVSTAAPVHENSGSGGSTGSGSSSGSAGGSSGSGSSGSSGGSSSGSGSGSSSGGGTSSGSDYNEHGGSSSDDGSAASSDGDSGESSGSEVSGIGDDLAAE